MLHFVASLELAKNGFIEVKNLGELTLDRGDHAYMKWGRMMASPASGNYSSKEFKYSGQMPIHLFFNDELTGIHQMEIKLYSGEKLTYHFKVNELPHSIFQKAIQSITSRGTVHISNIVVSDDELKVIFPQDFVFSVE